LGEEAWVERNKKDGEAVFEAGDLWLLLMKSISKKFGLFELPLQVMAAATRTDHYEPFPKLALTFVLNSFKRALCSVKSHEAF